MPPNYTIDKIAYTEVQHTSTCCTSVGGTTSDKIKTMKKVITLSFFFHLSVKISIILTLPNKFTKHVYLGLCKKR